MKIGITLLSVLAIIGMFTLGACNNDGPSGFSCSASFQFYAQIADEAQAYSTACSAYAQDSTTENCEACKAATRDYLEEAKKFKDCAYEQGQGEEYEEGIENAEEEPNELPCD